MWIILLISDWLQKWAVGFLSKDLLYINSPDYFISDYAITKFYYTLLLNNYMAHRIEFECTQIVRD